MSRRLYIANGHYTSHADLIRGTDSFVIAAKFRESRPQQNALRQGIDFYSFG
jgi:hypothetical protein